MKLISTDNQEISLTLANISNFKNSLNFSISELEMETINAISNVYLTPDYSKSIKEYVSLGRYIWRSDLISARNFPFQVYSPINKKVAIEIFAYRFRVNSEIVEASMKEKSFRPANIYELLEFGIRFKEFQRILPIISTGSIYVNKNGSRLIPFLHHRKNERKLGLDWYVNTWAPGTCFLAIKI